MGGESEVMVYLGVFTKHPFEIAKNLKRPTTPFNIQRFNIPTSLTSFTLQPAHR